ncbi:MAG: thioredoxin family protein [Spirochaetes bacterium]|nr:thioredoxin family protein [Spirochaetota bacterium]
MNKKLLITSFIIGLFLLPNTLFSEVMTKGAKPGIWTQDIEAAKKLAKNKKLPLFLNFTGSDWCTWCIHMDKQVFSTKKWQDFAKKNLVLVFIDFPQNQKLVPAEYKDRNDKIASFFNIQGYPTFYLINNNYTEVYGKLSASQSISPEQFIDSVEKLINRSYDSYYEKAKKMPKHEATLYKEEIGKLKKSHQFSQAKNIQYDENQSAEIEHQMNLITQQAVLKMLSQGKKEQFQKLLDQLADVEKEFTTWISTKPERNEENMKIYNKFLNQYQEINRKIIAFSEEAFQ